MTLADCVTVVLQHMDYSVGVQMVLQSMVAYGPKVMVLEDMVVYGFLHLAGVVGGLDGLVAHVLCFCDIFCLVPR